MKTSSQFLLTLLLNASWQIPIVVGVTSVGSYLLRDLSARYRHMLWVSALVLSFAIPVVTSSRVLLVDVPNTVSPVVLERQPFQTNATFERTAVANFPTAKSGWSLEIDRRIAFTLIAGYLAFVLWRFFRLAQAWLVTRGIRRSAFETDLSATIVDVIRRCESAVDLRTHVSILCSRDVPVPVAIGFRRPIIVLPESLLREGNVDLLTSAIGHEYVHIARRDYLLNFLCELICLPILFNPATALVRRRIKQTRELCCDEFVVERVLNAEVYARSLVTLASAAPTLRRLSVTTTVGIADADILEARIMSLLRKRKMNTRWNTFLLIGASLLLVVPCVAAAAFAVRYDVATPDEMTQDPKEAEVKEVLKRREQSSEQMKERRISPEMQEEIVAKMQFERQMMAVKQSALISLARITMEQAIQIATSQYPGKVLNCALDVDRWEEPGKIAKDGKIFYRVIVVSGVEGETAATHVWVNAIDGTLIKTEKELPRKVRSPEQR